MKQSSNLYHYGQSKSEIHLASFNGAELPFAICSYVGMNVVVKSFVLDFIILISFDIII